MKEVAVKIVDSASSEDAPKYGKEVPALDLKNCIIVGKGMTDGSPSVDLVFTDLDGKQYVALVSGKIIEAIGGAVAGKRMRDTQQSGKLN